MLTGTTAKVVNNTNGQVRSQYAWLCHCWGPQGPSIRLNQSTQERLQAGVMISDLPKTFAEAACICLKLGVSYIWIDALCKSGFFSASHHG